MSEYESNSDAYKLQSTTIIQLKGHLINTKCKIGFVSFCDTFQIVFGKIIKPKMKEDLSHQLPRPPGCWIFHDHDFCDFAKFTEIVS